MDGRDGCMADNTVKERLVRLEEKMVELKEKMTDLKTMMLDLKLTVNHEQETYNNRLVKVEKYCLENEYKFKGRMEFFKWLSVGLGAVATIVGVLAAFKVI